MGPASQGPGLKRQLHVAEVSSLRVIVVLVGSVILAGNWPDSVGRNVNRCAVEDGWESQSRRLWRRESARPVGAGPCRRLWPALRVSDAACHACRRSSGRP